MISKGGKAVNKEGNLINYEIKNSAKSVVSEQAINIVEQQIIELLKTGVFDSKSIVKKLKIDWSSRKVTSFLKKQDDVKIQKGKPMKFTHKNISLYSQIPLFKSI